MSAATIASVLERLRYSASTERYLFVLEIDGTKFGPCTYEEARAYVEKRYPVGPRNYTLTALEELP